MSAPCRNCKKREIGCHGRCEDYAAFKQELDEMRAKRQVENDKHPLLPERVKKQIWQYKYVRRRK